MHIKYAVPSAPNFKLTHLVRGQRMSACGEIDKAGRSQVNRRMESIHCAGQQQEPIEVIIGESR